MKKFTAAPLCLTLISYFAALGCSGDTQFSGSNSSAVTDAGEDAEATKEETSASDPSTGEAQAPAQSSADEPGAAAGAPAICDLDKDFVPVAFPENIKKCIDSSHIFNFYTQSCSNVAKATSFTCDFKGLTTALKGLNIDSSAVEKAIAAKAKLVGCGEKRAGKTIVTQWWFPTEKQISEKDCSFSAQTAITTGCFQQNDGDGTKTDASTPEERSEIIKKCLE